MATIVNNPGPGQERVIERSSDSGWAVAVIVLLAVVVLGAFWFFSWRPATAPQQGGANINVQLPASGSGNEGGGNAQGAGQTVPAGEPGGGPAY